MPDYIPTEQARDRALAIAADTERLADLMATMPMATDQMLRWRKTLTEIQSAYIGLVRECDRQLGE